MEVTQVKNIGSMNWSVGANRETTKSPFADVLKSAVEEVKGLEATNQHNNALLAAGQADSLHKIMIDMEKADVAFQFTLQVRNKIIDAYQEIMRMQI